MTKIQTHLLAGVLALSGIIPISAYADTDSLIISTDSGTKSKIALNTISDITFNNGAMVVATTDGPQEFQLGSIDEIMFDMVITGIDEITAPIGDDITISISGGVLTASSSQAATLQAYVYDMTGILRASASGNESITIDLASLQPGAYIVRVNDKTIKFIR